MFETFVVKENWKTIIMQVWIFCYCSQWNTCFNIRLGWLSVSYLPNRCFTNMFQNNLMIFRNIYNFGTRFSSFSFPKCFASTHPEGSFCKDHGQIFWKILAWEIFLVHYNGEIEIGKILVVEKGEKYQGRFHFCRKKDFQRPVKWVKYKSSTRTLYASFQLTIQL